MLKVDLQNGLLKDKDTKLQERANGLDIISMQVQATKENLEAREEILSKKQRLLNDRQELLLRNLKRK